MKSTGIVRRIDDLGRIVIPKEIRRNIDIVEGDPFEIHVNGDQIILRKYEPIDSPKNLIRELLENYEYPTKNMFTPSPDLIRRMRNAVKEVHNV